jgi:hypothetical protein
VAWTSSCEFYRVGSYIIAGPTCDRNGPFSGRHCPVRPCAIDSSLRVSHEVHGQVAVSSCKAAWLGLPHICSSPTVSHTTDLAPLIAGVVSGVLLVAALAAALWYLRRRRRQRRSPRVDLGASEIPEHTVALDSEELLPSYMDSASPEPRWSRPDVISAAPLGIESPGAAATSAPVGVTAPARRKVDVVLTWKHQTPASRQ